MRLPLLKLLFFEQIIEESLPYLAKQEAPLQVANPQNLYIFFRGRPSIAWQQTATCFLALTGAEASYADLGHFSVASIRVSRILPALQVLAPFPAAG